MRDISPIIQSKRRDTAIALHLVPLQPEDLPFCVQIRKCSPENYGKAVRAVFDEGAEQPGNVSRAEFMHVIQPFITEDPDYKPGFAENCSKQMLHYKRSLGANITPACFVNAVPVDPRALSQFA